MSGLKTIYLDRFLQICAGSVDKWFIKPTHIRQYMDETGKITIAKYKLSKIIDGNINDHFTGKPLQHYIYKLDGRSVRHMKRKVIV